MTTAVEPTSDSSGGLIDVTGISLRKLAAMAVGDSALDEAIRRAAKNAENVDVEAISAFNSAI